MKFGRRSVTLNAYRTLTGGPDEANRHQQLPCACRPVALRSRSAGREKRAGVDAHRETSVDAAHDRHRRLAAGPRRQGDEPPRQEAVAGDHERDARPRGRPLHHDRRRSRRRSSRRRQAVGAVVRSDGRPSRRDREMPLPQPKHKKKAEQQREVLPQAAPAASKATRREGSTPIRRRWKRPIQTVKPHVAGELRQAASITAQPENTKPRRVTSRRGFAFPDV